MAIETTVEREHITLLERVAFAADIDYRDSLVGSPRYRALKDLRRALMTARQACEQVIAAHELERSEDA